jgi:hypothetical protein
MHQLVNKTFTASRCTVQLGGGHTLYKPKNYGQWTEASSWYVAVYTLDSTCPYLPSYPTDLLATDLWHLIALFCFYLSTNIFCRDTHAPMHPFPIQKSHQVTEALFYCLSSYINICACTLKKKRNIEARSCNHSCQAKAVNIKYSECVSVFLP